MLLGACLLNVKLVRIQVDFFKKRVKCRGQDRTQAKFLRQLLESDPLNQRYFIFQIMAGFSKKIISSGPIPFM